MAATIFRQIRPCLGGKVSRQKGRHRQNANQVLLRSSRGCASDVSSGVPYETLQNENQEMAKEVPAYADAVIVGGGIVGCQTLYHLAKMGMTNVVLLEKENLTAGTTWHTAGMLWRLRPSDTDVALLRHSRDVYKTLEEETGVNAGWIENGGLFIASTKERLDEYKRLQTLGRSFGIESYVLGPEETKKLYPLMNVNDVYGTLYSPGDGSIDPAGACSALTRYARNLGAQTIEKCGVTGIGVAEDDFGIKRVRHVDTTAGRIKTNCIVNATGVWAPYIGAMAGVSVPLVAMHHSYIVTEKIEGIQNMPNTRDHDASVYLKLQGDGLSIGGYENDPIFWEKVEKDFAFALFELDWDVFSVHIEGAINRIPSVETSGIKSTVCGPESFTPDHKPLLGEAPEVRGFYHGCGFNSGGMMFGGGCGAQLAEWIIKGRPSLDMYGYDIRRYHPKLASNQAWVNQRSHESYAKNYAMVFPHDQALAARNQRCDPLHPILESAGCVFEEKLGWERPGWFSPESPAPLKPYDFYGAYNFDVHEDYEYRQLLTQDYTYDFPENHDIIAKESLCCRNRAALFNMSYFGQYYLTGPDALKAANWIFSADVDKAPGSVIYTCMLNARGGVEGDLTVTVVEPGDGRPHMPKFQEDRGFYVAVGGGAAQQGLDHIKKAIEDKQFDVTIIDSTDDMGLLSLQGPSSREILQKLTNADLSDEAFPFSTSQLISVGGHVVRALRLTFVGELGWELHVPFDAMIDVYNHLMSAGAEFGITNAGYRAIDSLSIEKGYRHWHADVRPDDTPQEAGLLFTCKLKTDTPFLGREAVEQQKQTGVDKRLACFTLDDRVHILGNEAIWRDGVCLGYLRRAEYGHHIEKSIGFGYVRHPEGEKVTPKWLGTGNYSIEIKGTHYPATFHAKTPFDPDNLRIKGIYDVSDNARREMIV